jgi:hypothetical protein
MWVVVGQGNNSIVTSTDGINWTGRGKLDFETCYDIAWNGSLWVAVGTPITPLSGNTVAYSTDGITWTGLRLTVFSRARTICWNGETFIAGGQIQNPGDFQILAYSTDGINWTQYPWTSGSYYYSFENNINWNGVTDKGVTLYPGQSASFIYTQCNVPTINPNNGKYNAQLQLENRWLLISSGE